MGSGVTAEVKGRLSGAYPGAYTDPGNGVICRDVQASTNGCAKKFIQTLKEQVLWIEHFETFEALRARVLEFTITYKLEWPPERHGYRTPTEARAHLVALAPPLLA